MDLHVLPTRDMVAHDYSANCICGPAIERRGEEGWLITHQLLGDWLEVRWVLHDPSGVAY